MRLLRDRRGVTAIEYGLLLVAILLVVAGGFRALGSANAKATKTTAQVILGGEGSAGGTGGSGTTGGGSGMTTGCDGRSCGAGDGNCFVAGTRVATPSGERPIESLAVGDVVLARGESDSAVRARPVVRTFVRAAPSLVDVRLVTIDGERERIRSTPEHPYWTLDRGWVAASELMASETLVDSAGREVRVTNVVPIAQEAAVYNIEVESDHTYFVGHTAVLVHNTCDPPGTGGTGPVTGPVTGGGVSPSSTNPVATNPNEAFFWSGRTDGVGGEAIARKIAESRGGTTLEATIEKRGITMPAWDTSNPDSVRAWENISEQYAKGVSGTVRAVVGKDLRPGNVWENKELPALKANPNVTKIIIIDPKTGGERVIFERK